MNIVHVRIHGTGKGEIFGVGDLKVQAGDAVIIDTEKGIELGIVSDMPQPGIEQKEKQLRKILRQATQEDQDCFSKNQEEEQKAYQIAKQAIKKLKLKMNLVDVEYTLDKQRLLFYFTSEGRVDFRDLVKELAAIYKTRIELRQIGVREEAQIIGGSGICGRELCCCGFMNEFIPVSIKMAKEQNLSMNPTKISGSCGRLLCCLKYEQNAYSDAINRMPPKGARVLTEQGEAIVRDVNLLKETVLLQLQEDLEAELFFLPLAEISPQKKDGCGGGCCKTEKPCCAKMMVES